ncbi:16342_t:CDS:2, partial [Dentiscutata erythropus]
MSDLSTKLNALKECYNNQLITYEVYCQYQEEIMSNWAKSNLSTTIVEDKSNEKSFWKRMFEAASQCLKFVVCELIGPILKHVVIALIDNK